MDNNDMNNNNESNENGSNLSAINQLVSKQEKMMDDLSELRTKLESHGTKTDDPETMSCSVCPSLKLKYEPQP